MVKMKDYLNKLLDSFFAKRRKEKYSPVEEEYTDKILESLDKNNFSYKKTTSTKYGEAYLYSSWLGELYLIFNGKNLVGIYAK